jgi:dihydrofolate synthase/folylpolyglutamate synthase
MNSAIQYLFSLEKFGMKFGLRNIRTLLHRLDNPHNKIRTIHIAGTNGKGSTSSMIAAILTAAGYKVGLYTSPHLVRFNERIRINGKMISDSDIAHYTRILKPTVREIKATFFETTTAMAFQYFFDNKVDIAVIETGLGGRLDSTNVLRPLVSVITTIGKDHTELLGRTDKSIAAEKAGIIKRRVPVVIGPIKSSAKKVIVNIAKQKLSPVLESKKLSIPYGCTIELLGKHQEANAKAALGAVNVVCRQFLVGDIAIRDGLENTSKLSGLRARFEIRKGTPDILIDVAHNPDGIKTLVAGLQQISCSKIVIILGVMKDKDYRMILQHLKRIKPIIIATQPHLDRALSSKQLYSLCKEMNIACFHASNVKEALRLGKAKTGKSGLLVVTGSHYLAGEIIPFIEKKS